MAFPSENNLEFALAAIRQTAEREARHELKCRVLYELDAVSLPGSNPGEYNKGFEDCVRRVREALQ